MQTRDCFARSPCHAPRLATVCTKKAKRASRVGELVTPGSLISGQPRRQPAGSRDGEGEAEHDGPASDLVLRLAVLHAVGRAGETSTASSPMTWPIRPPLATLHCETPPQCVPKALVHCRIRDPSRDLGAVASDELRRHVIAEVDPRGHRHLDGRAGVGDERDGGADSLAEVRVVEVERAGARVWVKTVAVSSSRSGSIWKMPPCAQSLAWIFIVVCGT